MTTSLTPTPNSTRSGRVTSHLRLDLPNLVWALAATHFVSRAGGAVQSFLVLYLTQEQRLTPTTAGAVVAAVGAGGIGSQILGGWLSDRIGRRHTMLAGFLGTAVALVGLGSADTLPTIWAAAACVGLMGDLFRPAGSAAVADLPPQQRIRAFGLLFWATNLGFSVATASAGILARRGYGLLFWINATAAVIAALIVWRRVPETRARTLKQTRRALLPTLLRDRLMIAMVLVHVAYFTLFLQTFTTTPLAMTADGHSAATYGTMLALNGLLIVAGQPLAVRLLAGRDPSTVLALSMLMVGAGVGSNSIVHSNSGYAVSVLVWSLGQTGIAVMFGTTFADLAPAGLRGGYMGVASATWNIGAMLGPLVGTTLLSHVGRTGLAVACAVAGTALCAAQLALRPALRSRTAPEKNNTVRLPTSDHLARDDRRT
ncbi:MFS transporter [Streptomyces sp. SID13726]|uniref:MFS transporter n=1 Tax=Streptomyces sp. SID13726 TaxID=2706058 RepID=UPI0013B8D95D|nr:MFS transporter [Streptomyces sp. SID13726]NEB02734.1 MFS transporter [Streptomyces sp. SID13726]